MKKFNLDLKNLELKYVTELNEKENLLNSKENIITELERENFLLSNEIKQIQREKETFFNELKSKNSRKIEEVEDYYSKELKKYQNVMKDQSDLIHSFETRVETSLENQKKIEEKYQKQIFELQEVHNFNDIY